MDKKKSLAKNLTSSLNKLDMNPTTKTISSSSSTFQPFEFPFRRKKPRKLVGLCIGLLGRHLEDIVDDLADIASAFPSDIKLILLAIARRRQILNDNILLALAEGSWIFLDLSGSDVSDFGLTKVAEMCSNLRAIDISQCSKITVLGVSSLVHYCRSLEILRCGGTPKSDHAARASLNVLKPELPDAECNSWEELDGSEDIGKGASSSLRWLVWPKIDENSKSFIETECLRITLNPKASLFSKVPEEALSTVPLDHSAVEDIDPKTWQVSAVVHRAQASTDDVRVDAPEISMAERFRLAFEERDARLAPKRAKNARQNRRRAEKEWLMSDAEAKASLLASQAAKFLRNR